MADPRDNDKRPDPDALLALSDREGRGDARRGRLKIFLGAAPGVGKTFAMLQAAVRLQDEGQDVVIGLVEEPEPQAPLGAKGVGEPPTVSSTPAVVAAIRDAIGKDLVRVPVRPTDIVF